MFINKTAQTRLNKLVRYYVLALLFTLLISILIVKPKAVHVLFFIWPAVSLTFLFFYYKLAKTVKHKQERRDIFYSRRLNLRPYAFLFIAFVMVVSFVVFVVNELWIN